MPQPPTRTLSTRILLLLELHARRHARLRTLATRLGVTVQAISVVLKRLVKERLVELRDGAWRATPVGTDAVQAAIRDLRRFVDDATGRLRFIEETLAQADGPIRAGQDVGLYLRDGRLRAAAGVYAGSSGRARSAARAGHLVRVGDLEGIVALKPGLLTFVSHPSHPGPSLARRARKVLARTERPRARVLVAAHSLSSAVLLEQAGQHPDFEFAPLGAALDAVRRGVPVHYWVPEEEVAACLSHVAEANQNGAHKVPVRSLAL